jgi:hypothetical protein
MESEQSEGPSKPIVIEGPSSADDFYDTLVIELPVHGPGGVLRVKVQAVDLEPFLDVTETLPAGFRKRAAENVDPTSVDIGGLRNDWQVAAPIIEKVCRLGIVAPRFWFDESIEGAVSWKRLPFQNRLAIFTAVMRLSGLLGGPADDAAGFRDDREGGAAGDGGDGAGEVPGVQTVRGDGLPGEAGPEGAVDH